MSGAITQGQLERAITFVLPEKIRREIFDRRLPRNIDPPRALVLDYQRSSKVKLADLLGLARLDKSFPNLAIDQSFNFVFCFV